MVGMTLSGGVRGQTVDGPDFEVTFTSHLNALLAEHGVEKEFKLRVLAVPAIVTVPNEKKGIFANTKDFTRDLLLGKAPKTAEEEEETMLNEWAMAAEGMFPNPAPARKKGLLDFLFKEHENAPAENERAYALKPITVKGTASTRKPLILDVPATMTVSNGMIVLVVEIGPSEHWAISTNRGTVQAMHSVVGEKRSCEEGFGPQRSFYFKDSFGVTLEIL